MVGQYSLPPESSVGHIAAETGHLWKKIVTVIFLEIIKLGDNCIQNFYLRSYNAVPL